MTKRHSETIAGAAITGCIVGIAFLGYVGGALGVIVGALLGWLFGPMDNKPMSGTDAK
ncbi:MAG: hypothetical protein AAB617_01030 [Patescibacteria group bacterium]